jgi:hypothetical protein
MAENKRDEGQPRIGDNSDPTGIGPPPPGAETSVEDGQGVTKAPELDGEKRGDGQASPSASGAQT